MRTFTKRKKLLIEEAKEAIPQKIKIKEIYVTDIINYI